MATSESDEDLRHHTVQLTPGTQLGPYEIEGPLGAGGMGQVYKARDARLGRAVAIKITSEQFSNRFAREARAISALNHQHICTLHDVGPNYLVMELVEGETLAARVSKGALPVDLVVRYGAQIADALAAAHAQGITHRDLKPANIMVTKAGVKVLDFGLAKDAHSDDTLTVTNAVMGTPAYMAPEQLEGKPCDARTDIYAVGLVLYEMAAGKRLSHGALPLLQGLPERVAHAIELCLAKDPENRWQSAQDLKLELEWSAKSEPARSPPPEKHAAKHWLTTLGFAALAALGGGAFVHYWQPTREERVLRLALPSPDDGTITGASGNVILSPDGGSVAYIATVGGKSTLWVRRLEGRFALSLASTEGAVFPFWSPDSRSLGFFANGKLMRIEVAGGEPRTICDAGVPRGGSWSSNGEIVFARFRSALSRVSASGGNPVPLTKVDRAVGDLGHYTPWILPGGRFLYYLRTAKRETQGVYVASLSKPDERTWLVGSTSGAIFAPPTGSAPGVLLYVNGTTLFAQPFDPNSLRMSGKPVTIAESVNFNPGSQVPASVSNNGLLLHHPERSGARLTWLNRQGQLLREPAPTEDDLIVRLSPDNRRAVLQRMAPETNYEIWIRDFERNLSTRISLSPTFHTNPVWSPDGRFLIYAKEGGFGPGHTRVVLRESSGVGGEVPVTTSTANAGYPQDWSRDGRYLLYTTSTPETRNDIWVLPLQPDGKAAPAAQPSPYVTSAADKGDPRFSPEPNPRWVAYHSDESGRNEVYVQAFPVPRGKWQISRAGGRSPQWGPSGREIYFVSPDRKLMAASVKPGTDSVESSAPQVLFPLPGANLGAAPYEAAADGQKFLILAAPSQAVPLPTLIVNWPAIFRKNTSTP